MPAKVASFSEQAIDRHVRQGVLDLKISRSEIQCVTWKYRLSADA